MSLVERHAHLDPERKVRRFLLPRETTIGRPRFLAGALALGLLAVAAVLYVPLAGAAAVPKCLIVNTSSDTSYPALQAAVDAATPGSTLKLKGTCFGTATINTSLTLTGQFNPGFGTPTLDGDNLGSVVSVGAGVNVTINNLTITHGIADFGGGIYNDGGTVTLTGSSSVVSNTAYVLGGGIFNVGALTLNNNSSVTGNTARVGGGIFNNGYNDTVTLNDRSVVKGNTAIDNGGGIDNFGALTLNGSSSVTANTAPSGVGGGIINVGTVTLNGSSSVASNTAYVLGGGIFNVGALTLNNSSSVTGNTASFGGGIFNAGAVTLNDSSLVTGNSPDNCAPVNTIPGCIN
jgi:hypothetical protein